MTVHDLWYLKMRDPQTGKRVPSKRHGRGMRWRVSYVDDTGQTVTEAFEKESDAKRFDASVRTDVLRGLYIDPEAGKITVKEYAQTWRQARLHRGSTAELVERTFTRHIIPILGHLAIAQVRSTHIQHWVKNVDLAPTTARVAYSYLVAMFITAVRDRVIGISPCVGITLPGLPSTERLILTPQQVHAIADKVPPRSRAAVYVGAGCGLRHGEAIGLELEHIDFLRRQITVAQQLTVISGRSPFLAPLKTQTSRRVVELPKVTADALARHIKEFPPGPVEVTDETDPRNVVRRSARLVFTNSKNRPIHRATWSTEWAPAARTVGLPPRTGFHALRHYFATLLIFAGASVKTVQLALGHSTPTVTLNEYVGLWPDQIDRTRTLVDQALGSTPGLVVAT